MAPCLGMCKILNNACEGNFIHMIDNEKAFQVIPTRNAIYRTLPVASVVHCFFSHERAMDREWRLKPFELPNFMIEWAQRILLESNAFLSGWNHLDPRFGVSCASRARAIKI